MSKIIPVILAGGSGTRLWPLSREAFPKQFVKFNAEGSLFQASLERVKNLDAPIFGKPVIITNEDFRFITAEQAQQSSETLPKIILEPDSRNTAASIIAATLFSQTLDDDPILLVMPSDHVIADTKYFQEAVKNCLEIVNRGKIATFGIKPTSVETGFGYLNVDQEISHNCLRVLQFIEKPSENDAQKFTESGNYLWNAGIFMFRAKAMVRAFSAYQRELMENVQRSINKGQKDLDFFRLDPECWSQVERISIDYAIMELSPDIVAYPYESDWTDLGDWASIWKNSVTDCDGNTTRERTHAIDCENTLLWSEADNLEVVGLGLNGLIVVATSDAVLVVSKHKSQDVKKLVSYLKKKSIAQATNMRLVHRPWGWFDSLALGDRFQVKCICVKPGGILSLQSHLHRSEHWVVVEGTAQVTIDNNVSIVGEGESIYVPLGAVHRLENKGKLPMRLIEVQTGSYFGEDDIVRYEDIYARN